MRPYFVVIFTYIGLKNRPKIYGRYLHFRILNFPLKYEPFKKNPCWLITTMGIIMSPRDYYRVIWMGIFLINNPHFLITTGSYTLFGGFLCHQETWGYSSECCNVQSVCCTLTHINIYIYTLQKPGPKNWYSWTSSFLFEGLPCPDSSPTCFFEPRHFYARLVAYPGSIRVVWQSDISRLLG